MIYYTLSIYEMEKRYEIKDKTNETSQSMIFKHTLINSII